MKTNPCSFEVLPASKFCHTVAGKYSWPAVPAVYGSVSRTNKPLDTSMGGGRYVFRLY